LKKTHNGMKQIFEGLEKNQESRVEAVKDLLKHFNETSRKEINADYPGDKLYSIPKLKLRKLCETIPHSSVNRLHLGEFLYSTTNRCSSTGPWWQRSSTSG
jgi:hypothetical protein